MSATVEIHGQYEDRDEALDYMECLAGRCELAGQHADAAAWCRLIELAARATVRDERSTTTKAIN